MGLVNFEHVGSACAVHDGELVEEASAVRDFFQGVQHSELGVLRKGIHPADEVLVLFHQFPVRLLDTYLVVTG